MWYKYILVYTVLVSYACHLLIYAGSVSSLDSSGMGEISSTCSEADNETSDGEEADIDTTDTFTGK